MSDERGHAGEGRDDGGGREPHEDHELMMERIIGFVGGLLLLIGASAVVSWLLYGAFKQRLMAEDPPPPPLVEAEAAVVPPPPRLQESPIRDMETLRERENAILNSYGWVDEDAGIAHIPIERAIDLMVERSVAPTPSGAPEGGAPDGGAR